MMNFTVTQFGKILHTNLYNWNEQTKTFTTNERDLFLDFSEMNGVTFKTSSHNTFIAGYSCVFETDQNCTFITGNHCKFNTGSDCIFKTVDYCSFNTQYRCVFNVGSQCIFNTEEDCVFKARYNCRFHVGEKCYLFYKLIDEEKQHKLEANKHVISTCNGELKEILGIIKTKTIPIFWWEENNEIFVSIEHSTFTLDNWIKNWEFYADVNEFSQELISEIPNYLNHLKTIENSLKTTSSTKPKQSRNALGQFCKNIQYTFTLNKQETK